jgi:hypothetical protein
MPNCVRVGAECTENELLKPAPADDKPADKEVIVYANVQAGGDVAEDGSWRSESVADDIQGEAF